MSEALPIDQLRAESVRFGTHLYLLTQGDDGRPHAVAVSIEWQGDRILTSTGTRSTANVAARPLVSLLWQSIVSEQPYHIASLSALWFSLLSGEAVIRRYDC
jgi:hypothetical protein